MFERRYPDQKIETAAPGGGLEAMWFLSYRWSNMHDDEREACPRVPRSRQRRGGYSSRVDAMTQLSE